LDGHAEEDLIDDTQTETGRLSGHPVFGSKLGTETVVGRYWEKPFITDGKE
jgi:hypothetical protein